MSNIGQRLIGASLAVLGIVGLLFMLFGQFNESQKSSFSDFIADGTNQSTAVHRFERTIASMHAEVYQSLLWLSMSVADIDPAALAERVESTLSAEHTALLESFDEMPQHNRHHELLRVVSRTLGRYRQDISTVLEMASADAAMATLMMSRAEDNSKNLFRAVDELRDVRSHSLHAGSLMLLEEQASERQFGYKVILFVLFFSVIAMILIARSITVPLRELTDAMGAIRSGEELEITTHVLSRSDEIGSMARAFAELENDRKLAQIKIARNHEHLEKLVAQRTLALENANQELQVRVTERTEAEAALRRSEEEHRNVLDGSLQGVFMHRDGLLVYANEAFANMLGYSNPTEVIELGRFTKTVAHCDRERLETYRRDQLIDRPVPASYEFRGLRVDGTTLPLLLSVRVIDWEGTRTVQCFAMDMTAHEESRVAIEHARDAALAAARTKSEFLANMSHEIRTPMNGVIGALALLDQSRLDEEQRSYSDVARVSGNSLLSLIDDILDFSKTEAGHLTLEAIPVKARSLIEDAIDMCAERAIEQGISLYCVEDSNVPEVIISDPSRLRQVITNLVSNAVKFTNEGEVVVSLRADAYHKTGPRLVVEVKDTGVGMAQGAVERIFDAFAQEDSTTTRRFGGTGLGLAICRQIVDRMNGTISAQSKFGKGSVFEVCVPLVAGVSDDDLPLKDKQAIVICDDDNLERDLVLQLADRMGMRTTVKTIQDIEATAASTTDADCVVCLLRHGSSDQAGGVLLSRQDSDVPWFFLEARRDAVSRIEAKNTRSLVWPARIDHLRDALIKKLHDGRHNEATPTKAEEVTCSSQQMPLSGMQVLVVDDVRINRILACKILERLGATIKATENGQETLEAVQAETFDAILMDCQMPVMDGYEATRRIRALNLPCASIPIIALTANAMKGDDELCYAAGMNDYMAKPLSIDLMAEKLEYWWAVQDAA